MASKFTYIGKQFRARTSAFGSHHMLEYKFKDGWKVCASFNSAWLPIFKANAADFKGFLRSTPDAIRPVRQ